MTSTPTGRSGAFNMARMDAGIPRGQQPFRVDYVKMTDSGGRTIMNPMTGRPVMTREYHFRTAGGQTVVIQDHGFGHPDFGLGGHFNVRNPDNLRTGPPAPGTQGHYFFGR